MLRRFADRLIGTGSSALPAPPPAPPTGALDVRFDETRRVYEEQQARIERTTTRLTFVITVATALFAAGMNKLPDYLSVLTDRSDLSGRFAIGRLGIEVPAFLPWHRDEAWITGFVLFYAATIVTAFLANAPRTISETPDPEHLATNLAATAEEIKQSILDAWVAVYAFNRLTVRTRERRLRVAIWLVVAEALYLGLAIVVAHSV